MTRGRSIDKTITPSRALTQQREYRARKANHTAILEEENAKLKVENAALVSQIRILKEEIHRRSRGDKIDRSAVEMAKEDVERALKRLSEIVRPAHRTSPPRRISVIQQATPDSIISLPPPPQSSQFSTTTQAYFSIPPPVLISPKQSNCCPPSQFSSMSQITSLPVQPHNTMTEPYSLIPTSTLTSNIYPNQTYNPSYNPYPYGSSIPNMIPVQPPPPQSIPQPQIINDATLPSYRSTYPESKEREECCLGLISCDPDPIPNT